jgi:hypothetical protein
MAMTTKVERKQSSLTKRVRQFYKLLNEGDFAACYELIDPRVRLKPASVTLFQYQNALREFLTEFGIVRIKDISVRVHRNEPSPLYEGRDFAVGKTVWEDGAGLQHVFSERWVHERQTWYTRSTGFVVPGNGKNGVSAGPPSTGSVGTRRRKQAPKIRGV